MAGGLGVLFFDEQCVDRRDLLWGGSLRLFVKHSEQSVEVKTTQFDKVLRVMGRHLSVEYILALTKFVLLIDMPTCICCGHVDCPFVAYYCVNFTLCSTFVHSATCHS